MEDRLTKERQNLTAVKENVLTRDLLNRKPCSLILQDGTRFNGYSFGANLSISGEVVFSTSMVGYPEALTDPSYRGQILCLTYPLIGNYGVPSRDVDPEGLSVSFESQQIQVRGLIVHEVCNTPSHWQSTSSLDEWLRDERITGIYGVDTRRLARILREKGVMLGTIKTSDIELDFDVAIEDPNKFDLVGEVSVERPITYQDGRAKRVVLIDCGVKNSIIKNLVSRNFTVVRVPYNTGVDEVMTFDPCGVVVSNGPGDPTKCSITIETIRKLIEYQMPMLGICLGNQLIALAEGAETYKMKYGHRSQNQPVIDVETGRCYITTQNHGYAVDKSRLEQAGLIAWFLNANDKSIEGIKHPTKPYWGVQWHPEASPGPTDTEFIFDFFASKVNKAAAT